MKKIVPFTKELMFKTKIGEITSISLDHTLKLENQFVSGEFIILGTYKILENGETENEFKYEIPVDITIDNKYDTKNCNISIDDFTYEIINEETLKVNISVMLDDLDIKEDPIERIEVDLDERDLDFDLIETPVDIPSNKEDENINNSNTDNVNIEIANNKDKSFDEELLDNINNEKEYSIYRVYTVKEDDTVDLILEKFNITRELLSDYNDLDNIIVGSKIIIPSIDE